MKVEFDNLNEVAASLDEASNARVEKTLIGEDAPSARAVLEDCLKDAERFKNLIVIRFNVTKDKEKPCHSQSELRMAVTDPHAAIHGTDAIQVMLDDLKKKVLLFLLDDLMHNRFGGGK